MKKITKNIKDTSKKFKIDVTVNPVRRILLNGILRISGCQKCDIVSQNEMNFFSELEKFGKILQYNRGSILFLPNESK